MALHSSFGLMGGNGEMPTFALHLIGGHSQWMWLPLRGSGEKGPKPYAGVRTPDPICGDPGRSVG